MWCEWDHQPSDWVIYHEIFFKCFLQLVVWPQIYRFQITCLWENVISETLLFILSLLPNILVWYYWYYGLFYQCWYHNNFILWRYWGDLILVLLGWYNQRTNQTIWLVFQRKSYSVVPWGYHMFLLQEWIYMYYKSTRRQCVQMSFWWSWIQQG